MKKIFLIILVLLFITIFPKFYKQDSVVTASTETITTLMQLLPNSDSIFVVNVKKLLTSPLYNDLKNQPDIKRILGRLDYIKSYGADINQIDCLAIIPIDSGKPGNEPAIVAIGTFDQLIETVTKKGSQVGINTETYGSNSLHVIDPRKNNKISPDVAPLVINNKDFLMIQALASRLSETGAMNLRQQPFAFAFLNKNVVVLGTQYNVTKVLDVQNKKFLTLASNAQLFNLFQETDRGADIRFVTIISKKMREEMQSVVYGGNVEVSKILKPLMTINSIFGSVNFSTEQVGINAVLRTNSSTGAKFIYNELISLIHPNENISKDSFNIPSLQNNTSDIYKMVNVLDKGTDIGIVVNVPINMINPGLKKQIK